MKTTQDTICEAIVEAQAAYLSLKRISEVTGISIRTLQRWMQQSSEGNPFSELLFKTLKYRPGYPGKLQSLNEALNWVANFVYWYNCEHRNRLCNARTTR